MAIIKADLNVFAIRTYVCLIFFSIAGHLFTIFLRLSPGFVAPIAGFLTLASGVVASQIDYWRSGKRSALRASFLVLLVGFSVEIQGLATGFPFGRYRYTDQWWPTVLLPRIGHFPLLLPFAWLLVAGAAAFSCQVTKSKIANALIAALAATGLDLLMEGALAGKLDYWKWISTGPLPGSSPSSNSVSWFGLTFFAALILYAPSVQVEKRGSVIVLVGQALLMLTFLLGG